MLRLDKTISRKTTLHDDQDADDRAYWASRTTEQRLKILEYLRHQRKMLEALSKLPHLPQKNKASGSSIE